MGRRGKDGSPKLVFSFTNLFEARLWTRTFSGCPSILQWFLFCVFWVESLKPKGSDVTASGCECKKREVVAQLRFRFGVLGFGVVPVVV